MTTVDRLLPKLRIAGITRVADVTGLDTIGIPVVMSARPASRSLSVQQGKGATLTAAKASAVMESIESFCAEQPSRGLVWKPLEAWAESEIAYPAPRAHRRPEPGEAMPWVAGEDLLSGRETFVPEELVTLDLTRPVRAGYGWFGSNSNGLAAGNTLAEATLHGLCEVIEHDAVARWRRASRDERSALRIEPRLVEDAWVHAMMRRYDAVGMVVEVWDVTTALDVPAFHCVIDDKDGVPPYLGRFSGSGCHPDVTVALARALSEAAQSRLTLITGMRDDLGPENYAGVSWERNFISLIMSSEADPPGPPRPPRAESFSGDDLEQDLAEVLRRMGRRDVGPVVRVDLTHPGLAEPCIRIVAPSLGQPAPRAA